VPHLQSAQLQSLLGICVLIAVAWALSENRRIFNWRMVAGTLLLQALIVAAIGPETKNRSLEEIAGSTAAETPAEADTSPAGAFK